MRVLMIFADGVGLGREDPTRNPFFAAELPTIITLLGGSLPSKKNRRIETRDALLIPLNPALGVNGLPQSGTGQATIFTGTNAAKLIGQHFGPYPHSKLKPLLNSQNLFRQLLDLKKSVCFVNAYPKQFHEAIARRRLRYTVTTFCAISSGMTLRGYEELKAGQAISADITGKRWVEFGYDHLPILTPRSAGKRFSAISKQYDFTLFEYFLTDHAGHGRNMATAIEVLERLDGFLGGVLENFDEENSLLILTSDHGNIEDLSSKSHTHNPVPLLLVGGRKRSLGRKLRSLRQITPGIVDLLAN